MRLSMWSRKGIEVEMRYFPDPSRFNSTRTSVSFVFRETLAFLGMGPFLLGMEFEDRIP
jgi:hypothetical protein